MLSYKEWNESSQDQRQRDLRRQLKQAWKGGDLESAILQLCSGIKENLTSSDQDLALFELSGVLYEAKESQSMRNRGLEVADRIQDPDARWEAKAYLYIEHLRAVRFSYPTLVESIKFLQTIPSVHLLNLVCNLLYTHAYALQLEGNEARCLKAGLPLAAIVDACDERSEQVASFRNLLHLIDSR